MYAIQVDVAVGAPWRDSDDEDVGTVGVGQGSQVCSLLGFGGFADENIQ
jgi:hypothetical protein